MAADQPDDRGGLADAYRSGATAEAWQRGVAARTGMLGLVTQRMLDLAGVGPGQRVLDIAAGTGEQTIMAANRVGADGYVLAVDISPEMLAVAAEQARGAGLANVETLAQDAQALDLEPESFNAAICRSGLMLMADPVSALVGIRRALRPGSSLAVLVFGAAEQNPLQWLPTSIARRMAGLSPLSSSEPGMFALGTPGTLEDVFRRGGFQDVFIESHATTRRFPSASDAVRSLKDTLPSVHAILRRVDEAERDRAWAEIERALRDLERPDGLTVHGEFLIGVGKR